MRLSLYEVTTLVVASESYSIVVVLFSMQSAPTTNYLLNYHPRMKWNIWEKFPKMIINNTLSEINKKSCIKSKGLPKEIVNLHILYMFFIWRFGGFGFKLSN